MSEGKRLRLNIEDFETEDGYDFLYITWEICRRNDLFSYSYKYDGSFSDVRTSTIRELLFRSVLFNRKSWTRPLVWALSTFTWPQTASFRNSERNFFFVKFHTFFFFFNPSLSGLVSICVYFQRLENFLDIILRKYFSSGLTDISITYDVLVLQINKNSTKKHIINFFSSLIARSVCYELW